MSHWVKVRKPPSEYPETEQQKKIKVAGKVVGLVCKGKKKKDFVQCRHDVLACVFEKDTTKCNVQIENAKDDVERKIEKS